MSLEGTEVEKKSLRLLTKPRPDWNDLARTCVAFANARGGRILIGIEDHADQPPAAQRVPHDLPECISKRIPQITLNVGILPRIITDQNGGELIELNVFRSAQTVAATSDGRYFIRVADESRSVLPDDLTRLMNDKSAYTWETQTSKHISRSRVDGVKCDSFLQAMRKSARVSDFVKEKTDDELLDYYLLTDGPVLTNLGILWMGRREDRATLLYAPVIQFIKYDEQERKVAKLTWDDFSLNPLELIEAIWTQVPDWRESYEFPDGLFRKTVPHYDELVVRELVANALVHRPYTQRGDIFINLYFKGLTTLKGIETHRLKELILRDLEIYGHSGLADIHGRIGSEIPRRKVQHILWGLVDEGEVVMQGKTRGAVYLLHKDRSNTGKSEQY